MIKKIHSYFLIVAIVVGHAGLSALQAADKAGNYILVSRKGGVTYAKSAKTKETLFEHSDPRQVIEWAVGNGDITVLEPGTYTITDAVRVSRSGVSLIIKKGATLRMPRGTGSSYVSEYGADYYPLIYVAPSDVFTKSIRLENVSIINFGTLDACGKTDKKSGRWGGGACIIYDGRKWERTCGIVGGTIFSSGVMTGCRGAALWILDCKKTEIPLMCAENYGNGVVAAEGCEDLNIGILAGLAGKKAEENETIDLNYFNRNVHIKTVIGSYPSEEIVDINNAVNCTVENIVGYGFRKKARLLGKKNYAITGAWMTMKRPIKESRGTVAEKTKRVNKKVKEWKRITKVPPLPESLPRFTVKAKLIAIFKDGSQEIVFDETIPFNLGRSE